MTTSSLNLRISHAHGEQTCDDAQWLFSRESLEKIAYVFGVSKEKIQRLNSDWDLQNKCFKKIVRACESENWEKIHLVRDLITGIKDSRGRSVCEALTHGDNAIPNFCVDLPENLIFQGGGPKGIAYIGVLEVLEERNIMPVIKRVGGTSAGAMTATLIAMGYTTSEIREFLAGKEIMDFLDSPLSNWGGICKGEEFLNWINKLIEQKTGIPNCTFSELRREIKKGKDFKHLHVFATKVGSNKRMFQFSSEDKQWNDLVIADAVRASMSLPIAFPPHTLHFKNMKNGLRCPCEDFGSFMDGGLSGELFNLPIDAFDKKKFISPCLSEIEGEHQITNKRTLAFALYTPGEDIPKKDTRVTCIITAYNQWRESEKDAAKIYRKTKRIDPYRIVKISNCRVRTDDFWLSDQKKQELINSGRSSTRAFFQDQEETLSKLNELEEKKYQQKSATFFYKLYRNNKSEESVLGVEIVGNNISFHSDYSYSMSFLIGPFRDQFSFTRLADLDERFLIFIHLRNKNLDQANIIYQNNQFFFKNCFSWDIFRKLIIERNCPEYLHFFMSKGFSFVSETFHPIWYAYKCESFKALEALLKDTNIDLTVLEPETNKTLLYYFSKEGQYDLVESFCAAFKERHPKLYKVLLNHEVNSNVGIKKSAFVIALEKKHIKIAEFLVNQGADYLKDGPTLLNKKYLCCGNNIGARNLLLNVLSGRIDRDLSSVEKKKALDFCLSYEVNLKHINEHHTVFETYGDEGAVDWSTVQIGSDFYTEDDGYRNAKLLIGNKIINSPTYDAESSTGSGLLLTILQSARIKTRLEEDLVGVLVTGKHRSDVNRFNNDGETPLIIVAKDYSLTQNRESIKIFKRLLTTKGIDVNHQDRRGNTALHYAAIGRKTDFIECLLAHPDIRPKIFNNNGEIPSIVIAR